MPIDHNQIKNIFSLDETGILTQQAVLLVTCSLQADQRPPLEFIEKNFSQMAFVI
jgi:hypothetical protein